MASQLPVTVTTLLLAFATSGKAATTTFAFADPLVLLAQQRPPATPATTLPQRVLKLVNAARARGANCGGTRYAPAPPLALHPKLNAAAQAHAKDMATQDYFEHDSADGRTPEDRLDAAGYPWQQWAENIYAGESTPEAAVAGWMKSPPHCANIMNPKLKELGVGYAYNASSTYGHYWVQNFGTR